MINMKKLSNYEILPEKLENGGKMIAKINNEIIVEKEYNNDYGLAMAMADISLQLFYKQKWALHDLS